MSTRPVTVVAVLLLLPLASGCRIAPPPPSDPGPFDWTLGSWQGVRQDGGDGSREPMGMEVEPILAGKGQCHELEIHHSGGIYRGFAVQVYDPGLGCWVRQYVNDVRGTFARLEGNPTDQGSLWRSATPGRSRETRLVSEQEGPDRWVRTLSVSEDGGATWKIRFVDELYRVTGR